MRITRIRKAKNYRIFRDFTWPATGLPDFEFASKGVLVTTDEATRDPDSDFEVSVANVNTSMGFEVKPQLGVAGYFLDMAVRNPDRPGEFLAGIEWDGATYHSGFSVRDRDRIRQDILEVLGWRDRIYRIWSTDWFYDPRRESERLRQFLDERRRISANETLTDWDRQDEEDEGLYKAPAAHNAEQLLAATEAANIIAASASSDDIFVGGRRPRHILFFRCASRPPQRPHR